MKGITPNPTIHILPIEPIPMRYSADWLTWWDKGLKAHGATTETYVGALDLEQPNTQTDFANWVSTWDWKGTQIAELARNWHKVKDFDWVLNLEGWGVAALAVKYMAAMTGKRVYVASFFHAGLFDPWDRLSQVPPASAAKWMKPFEESMIQATDLVLCGSDFAYNLMQRYHPSACGSFVSCGCPVFRDNDELLEMQFAQRGNVVVFPHRDAPEKDPDKYQRIKRLAKRKASERCIDDLEFIETQNVVQTKAEYFDVLRRSRVALSTARQETFGIAMQEAAAAGCWLVCPHDLAYPEVVRQAGDDFLYRSEEQAANFILDALERDTPAPWDAHHERAIKRAYEAMTDFATYRKPKH